MRDIPHFEKEISVEDFVKIEICKNGGTQSVAFKNQLEGICESVGIEYRGLTKEQLFDSLINSGQTTHKELAAHFGVGVSSQVYQKTFGITHKDVKRLEKKGIITAVGFYRFRAYGKYMHAPLYDVYQFISIPEETIKGN